MKPGRQVVYALRWMALVLVLAGCSFMLVDTFRPQPQEPSDSTRTVPRDSYWGQYYLREVEPILEQRCMVCHGCYDAPCQLKLTSAAGLERGASKQQVYNGTRVLPADPTRLGLDAHTIAQWRQKSFHPVLTEPGVTSQSLMQQMLQLKQDHPLPADPKLRDFSLGLDRNQQCPTPESFAGFRRDFPLWGMPYALPGLPRMENHRLMRWLEAGALLPDAETLPEPYQKQVVQWEQFLNGDSLKSRLVSRYIFEHLFLGHLYFDELETRGQQPAHWFKLVRSYTPPGEPLEVVATRRPYDAPQAERIYYRLQLDDSVPLAKTLMPYALNRGRMEKWRRWFFQPSYTVTRLPSYEADKASNPFVTFRQLPVESRYRFMLDEAEFTINGFIKGPVCRGQVALNVIRDRFWVFFVDPDSIGPTESAEFLAENSDHLVLPAEAENTLMPLGKWLYYSRQFKQYLHARNDFAQRYLQASAQPLDTQLVWDGDGDNHNAALTVLRHFDSATVVKGLVGEDPQTAWVVGYPALERIHYLLVAGFDVFGNVSHQLLTRLYMDFLRMESEQLFVLLLPPEEQKKQWRDWYRGALDEVSEYVLASTEGMKLHSNVPYHSNNPKAELYQALRQRLGPVIDHRYDLSQVQSTMHRTWLQRMASLRYPALDQLPQITLLSVMDTTGQMHLYTLLRDNAHSNIASLLNESSNRLPEEDGLTVVNGVLGAYPSAFWSIRESQLPELTEDLEALRSAEDYAHFMARYGVRRTDPNFWSHSDRVHRAYKHSGVVDYGLLDYNRLESL